MKNTLLYISKEVYIDLRELLQVGRVIENDRGEMGIILPDRIIYRSGWSELKYDEALRYTNRNCDSLDIIGIYDAPKTKFTCWNFSSEKKVLLKKVWIKHKPQFSSTARILLSLISHTQTYIARDQSASGGEKGDIYAYSTTQY